MKNPRQFAHDAEVRAVEEGHRAFVTEGGVIDVKSDTSDKHYKVRFVALNNGEIHFNCTCPSGVNRGHLRVPCKHSALAGRRLEREKLAVWQDGLFLVHPDVPRAKMIVPENPLEGLPQP